MEQWIQIISTYGVSIAAMIALACYIVKKDKEISKLSMKL